MRKRLTIIGCLLVILLLAAIGVYKFLSYKTVRRHHVHVAACLLLCDENKVVMGLRKKENQYGFIGGHLEANETICQALLREAKEEANIDVDPKNVELVHVLHCYGRFNYIFFFFKTNCWRGVLKNMEPEKCAGWEWFDLQNPPKNMTNPTRIGLENILNGIFFSDYTHKQI